MMPKASSALALPLNGLFPIAKPSGPSSMQCIDSITPLLLDSKLFYDPSRIRDAEKRKKKQNLTHMGLKIGQGGTLDPLADGVLVIGVNRGTKHLNRFLECSKEYETVGLLGAATTTYDSEGPVMSTHSFDGITKQDIEKALDKFRGKIKQTPPIFSALKMDGKKLYEYARESQPLPRPIPVRECEVSIEVTDFTPAQTPSSPEDPKSPESPGHTYRWPEQRLSEEEKTVFKRLTEMVHKSAESSHDSTAESSLPLEISSEYPEISEKTGLRPPTFTLKMTVSSGTYVRSIVHDIGLALGCGAHVVKLTRTRQGEFSLVGDEETLLDDVKPIIIGGGGGGGAAADGSDEEGMMNEKLEVSLGDRQAGTSGGCITWDTWERALTERKEMLKAEQEEREEAQSNGMSADEVKKRFSKDAIMARRRERDLKEWEVEMLKRYR